MSCQFKFKIGAKRGTECGKKLSKKSAEYCTFHIRDIARTGKLKTNATISDDVVFNNTPAPDIKNRKEKKSIFNITINSNKNYYNMTAEDKTKFKRLIDYLFTGSQPNILKYLFDATEPTNPMTNIINFHSGATFEVANSNHRLHSHATLEITHNGFYQIRAPDLRTIINKFLGYVCHINISSQKISTNSSAWADYMRKGYKEVVITDTTVV